jgi:hypothetical protein
MAGYSFQIGPILVVEEPFTVNNALKFLPASDYLDMLLRSLT